MTLFVNLLGFAKSSHISDYWLTLTQDSQSDSVRAMKKAHVFTYYLDIYWARQNEVSNSVDI